MAQEIERKYLVKDPSFLFGLEGLSICQGYVYNSTGATVRVRTKGAKAFLTAKSGSKGISREEAEMEISLELANELLRDACGGLVIDKVRYEIQEGQHLWEVDVFSGNNEGLVVAEIELKSEHETFSIPQWAGDEVSDDLRYYNSELIRHPFITWT